MVCRGAGLEASRVERLQEHPPVLAIESTSNDYARRLVCIQSVFVRKGDASDPTQVRQCEGIGGFT